jgi:hypothetical protein
MFKQYKLLVITAFIVVIIIFIPVSFLTDQYYQSLDRENYGKFLQGDAFYTPTINGLPWEVNTVYNEVHNLAPENNLILFGASTTREGILPDQIVLPGNWTLHNFALGSETIRSFGIMKNYLNTYAEHKPDKSDVVAVHIFYGTFVELPEYKDYTKQIIEETGMYTVDESGNVNGTDVQPQIFLDLSMYKIQKLFSTLSADSDKTFTKMFFTSQNGSVNESDEGKIKGYKKFWSDYTQNAAYPGNSTEEFKKFIHQLNNQTNVVVINMYIPSWQRSSPKEQEYEAWVKNDLKPDLQNESIPYIDFSTSIPDSEYGDSAHLFKSGRERYSDLFMKEISPILVNYSGSSLKAA